MGVFFVENEHILLSVLDSVASTRDSIAHGNIGVEITKKQLEIQFQKPKPSVRDDFFNPRDPFFNHFSTSLRMQTPFKFRVDH
jgi:hypothetical protein